MTTLSIFLTRSSFSDTISHIKQGKLKGIIILATLKEVAKEAGVSIKTVSRVVNQETSVNKETREKVLKVIEALNYRPNHFAKMMRLQRSDYIGVISDAAVTSPWATEMISGIQDTLLAAGKIPLILSASVDDDDFSSQMANLHSRQVDGFIYAAMYHKEIDFHYDVAGRPLILCNCFDIENRFPSIVPDDYQGGYDAAEHLVKQGYRKIAYLGIQKKEIAGQLRYQAYLDVMKKYNLEVNKKWIDFEPAYESHFAAKKAYEVLLEPEKPDAFIAGNDQYALQIWEAASKLNLKVGEDFAVIGFDDFEPITNNIYPGLTSLKLPHHDLGAQAANLFLENKLTNQKIEVECPLILRASTSKK